MKTKLLFLSALIIAGSVFSTSGFAQSNCKGHNPENAPKSCIMDDLTPAQKEKVEAIKADSEKKMVQYHADLKIKKAELDKLLVAENPSKADIDAKIDEISVLKATIEKEKVAKRLLIRNELTPEQRAKFDSMHAKKDGCKGEHGEGMKKDCNHGAMPQEGPDQMHKGCNHGDAGATHEGCNKAVQK